MENGVTAGWEMGLAPEWPFSYGQFQGLKLPDRQDPRVPWQRHIVVLNGSQVTTCGWFSETQINCGGRGPCTLTKGVGIRFMPEEKQYLPEAQFILKMFL